MINFFITNTNITIINMKYETNQSFQLTNEYCWINKGKLVRPFVPVKVPKIGSILFSRYKIS